MARRRFGSFVAGAASTLACVVAWWAAKATPATLERHVPVPSAWMWTPAAARWTAVPYARPLAQPELRRAQDGSILAMEHGATLGARHDDAGVQRLHGDRFALLAGAQGEEVPPGAPWRHWRQRIVGGTWLAGDSNTGTKVIPTVVFRSGAWKKAPTVPADRVVVEAVVALEGGRLVAWCSDLPPRTGPPAVMLGVAREGDADFRMIRVPAYDGGTSLMFMAPAGSHEVLVLTVPPDNGPRERVQIVDVDTGAVRQAPAGPEPFPAGVRSRSVSWAPLDDGRVLLAPVVDGVEHPVNPAILVRLAIAAALTAATAGGLWALRRRLDVRSVVWGVVLAPVLALVVGFALAVLVASSLRL
jgi:hypothetical protein